MHPFQPDSYEIVGESAPMRQVRALIEIAAQSDEPVLIEGETGTGKECVARTIHQMGNRRDGPFMPTNCGMFNPNLLESELFGHERGAFTGAHRAKIGKLELADGGTLFLDDVDDVPFDLQVKLVRVLQEFQFERVGGVMTHRVDIRVITASKRKLAEMVGEGTFRDDLYYRLKVLSITLPPLRERKEDIPLLVQHFLRRYADEGRHLTQDALDVLMNYEWPGNVRELENLIRRMIATYSENPLGIHHIPRTLRYGRVIKLMPENTDRIPFQQLLQQAERQLIMIALERANWNQSRAAEILDLKRSTLLSKMKRLRIPTKPPQ